MWVAAQAVPAQDGGDDAPLPNADPGVPHGDREAPLPKDGQGRPQGDGDLNQFRMVMMMMKKEKGKEKEGGNCPRRRRPC